MNFRFPRNFSSKLSPYLVKNIRFPSISTYPTDKSYAVVFSSSILLNGKQGSEIDDHDYVIRFNFAPTRGFEEYVGSKTTHRFLGGHKGSPYFYREKNEHVFSWVTGSNPRDLSNPFVPLSVANTVKYVYAASKHKENANYFKHFNFMYCTEFGYDAGMKFLDGLLLSSMKGYKAVNVYGFETIVNDSASSYHYFDDTINKVYASQIMKDYVFDNPWDKIISGAKITQAYKNHNYNLSKNIISKLAQKGMLNIK